MLTLRVGKAQQRFNCELNTKAKQTQDFLWLKTLNVKKVTSSNVVKSIMISTVSILN